MEKLLDFHNCKRSIKRSHPYYITQWIYTYYEKPVRQLSVFIVLLIHLPPSIRWSHPIWCLVLISIHPYSPFHTIYPCVVIEKAPWPPLLSVFIILTSTTPSCTLISPSPNLSFLSPPPAAALLCSLTLAQWTGRLLLADGLLQAADDAVLVPETLTIGGPQSLHLAAMLDAVPLQLDPVLVGLLLQLLEVGVLLQKSQQVGHHRHQGRLWQLGSTETHTHTRTHGHTV